MRKVLALLMVVAAACGDAGVTTTNTTATTAAPTTTSATTSTSAAPVTTQSATTTAPTTTAVAQAASVAASSDCVLGWWDGSWRSVDDDFDAVPPVEAGALVQVATLGGVTTAEVVELSPYDDIGQPAWSLLTTPTLGAGVSISGSWDPLPHPVTLAAASQQVYLDQVAEIMSQRGYPGVPIELAQVIRTDLEGDGVDEAIVVARHPGAPTYDREVGVFSVVLLRRVIDEQVETAILHLSVYSEEDVGLATSAEHALVAAVADLNGDGKMEITIDATGYEWYWSETFEYVDDDLGPVSRMVCGGGV